MNLYLQLFVYLFCLLGKITASQLPGLVCFEDGFKTSLWKSCNYYLECHRGVYVIKQCGLGKYFSLKKNNCTALDESLPTTCYDECHFKINIPVKGVKTKFLYCENGILKLGECEKYFDRLLKRCKFDDNIHEPKIFSHTNEYLFNSKHESTVPCLPGRKKAIQNVCQSYMVCDSTSKWTLAQCQECQNFEPISLNCAWSWKYYCTSTTFKPPVSTTTSRTSTTDPGSTGPHSSTSTSTIDTLPTTEKPTSQPPACSTNGETKIYKKGDCKDYLQCESGNWVKKSCSYGYDFDINKLECTWSWWARC